ncbi:MAG: DUF1552 domain-containing protein [Myxococcota bacterium]
MKLSRRRMLWTAGVGLGLPWLGSHRSVRGDERPVRPRFIALYSANGMHMPAWTPADLGRGFALSPILAPLAELRDQFDVFGGLHNTAADIDTAGHHATGTAGFLSARQAHRSESALSLGVSLDTLLDPDALALGLDDGQAYGDCDNGFSCAYSRNVSWLDDTTPRPKLADPQLAFDALFSGFDPAATAGERQRRRVTRTSVLDAVADQTEALRVELGQDDGNTLETFLADVRDLELRVEETAPACDAQRPDEVPVDLETHAEVMLDLIVTALRCDLRDAATLMLDNSASDRVYTSLGITRGHHELSHVARALDRTDDLVAIGAWQVDRLAGLLKRLHDTPAGNGSLLDETLVLFSNELSDGNRHSHEDLPTVVAGGRALGREPGRHVVLDADWADLLLSLGHRLGLPLQTFGDHGARILDEV